MKRYTVFTFPSLFGTPKQFRFKICAVIYALFTSGVHELQDNKTGDYKAYWI